MKGNASTQVGLSEPVSLLSLLTDKTMNTGKFTNNYTMEEDSFPLRNCESQAVEECLELCDSSDCPACSDLRLRQWSHVSGRNIYTKDVYFHFSYFFDSFFLKSNSACF